MKQAQVARRFDMRAAYYDNPLTAYLGELELRQIRKLAPPGSQVLDFGSGSGRTTVDLLKRGCSVTAYDISGNMLNLAKRKVKSLGLEAEFVGDYDLLNGRVWPVVTCIGVLDYYSDTLPILSCLRRHLLPSGCLIATVPNALSPFGWLYWLSSRFTVPASPHTPRNFCNSARQAGYSINRVLYAVPAYASIGYTIVAALTPIPSWP